MSVADLLVPNPYLCGQYTPIWTNVSGFTGSPTASGFFIRLGAFVVFALNTTPVTTPGGTATATITLPVVPAFTFLGGEVAGSVSPFLAWNEASILATVGSTTATITVLSGADTGPIQVIGMYRTA